MAVRRETSGFSSTQMKNGYIRASGDFATPFRGATLTAARTGANG
jgi:hypothetical protein